MARAFVAFIVVVSAVSCGAYGRISDPEVGGELDFIYEDGNFGTEFTGMHVFVQGFFPAVRLDGRYPNSLQPFAQKASNLRIGIGEREYPDPYGDSSRTFSLSGTDFAYMGVGLTATYATEALDYYANNVETTSVGIIGNWFPGLYLQLDYNTRIEYTVFGHLSSESLVWNLGGYIPATRLWWQGSAEFIWGEGATSYENRYQALVMFFITDSISVGAAATTIVPETGLNTRIGSVDLRLSTQKLLVDIEAASDLDVDGGTSFGIQVGFRY